MKTKSLATFALFLASLPAFAGKLPEGVSIEPNAIVHLDAATYAGELRKDFSTGFSLTEARLGATGIFGNWKVHILVGFANNKVGLRDVYAQYNFNDKNYIRAGHFVHQFGYQNSTAAYDKPTMIAPVSESVFNVGQRLGIAYVHHGDKFFGSASIFTGNEAISHSLGNIDGALKNENLGLKCRTAFHPFNDNTHGNIFQIGLGGIFETPQYNVVKNGKADPDRSFIFKAAFPTKVCNVTALEQEYANARNRWEISPDLLLAHGHLALEAQYFYTRINPVQPDSPGAHRDAHHALGGYINLRGILKGKGYSFSNSASGLANPAPKTLEGILTFDCTDFQKPYDSELTKRMFDYAATLNYYINKYMVFRLRAGYTCVKDAETYVYDYVVGDQYTDIPGHGAETFKNLSDRYRGLFSLQARLQIVF